MKKGLGALGKRELVRGSVVYRNVMMASRHDGL